MHICNEYVSYRDHSEIYNSLISDEPSKSVDLIIDEIIFVWATN